LLGIFAVAYAGMELSLTVFSPGRRETAGTAGPLASPAFTIETSPNAKIWDDSFGDGFPACARLDRPADRENYARWMTFLAEAAYYHPSPPVTEEVQDCAALIRYAYRNALTAHTPAWHRDVGLPHEPGFGDISKYAYHAGRWVAASFAHAPGPSRPRTSRTARSASLPTRTR